MGTEIGQAGHDGRGRQPCDPAGDLTESEESAKLRFGADGYFRLIDRAGQLYVIVTGPARNCAEYLSHGYTASPPEVRQRDILTWW